MKPIPDNLPEYVKRALTVFNSDELKNLRAIFDEDGRFLGIGFIGPGGKYCKFANPEKASAIAVLEEQYRMELDNGAWDRVQNWLTYGS